jgi:hypothetical protein
LTIPVGHQESNGVFEHLFALAVALGFAAKASKEVAEQAVVALDGEGFRF